MDRRVAFPHQIKQPAQTILLRWNFEHTPGRQAEGGERRHQHQKQRFIFAVEGDVQEDIEP